MMKLKKGKRTQIAGRESGVELLKIIAILLIVASHVVQTLCSNNDLVAFQDYVLALNTATIEKQKLILSIMRHFGILGNAMFFVCSAWFLVGRRKTSRQKAFQILLDVWVISVIWLAVVLVQRHGSLPQDMIFKQLFPSTYSNNWYLTCYIIFLLAYPILNRVIDGLEQRQHLRITVVMSFLWIVWEFPWGGRFFPSELILWTTIYFIVAYIKMYFNKLQNSIKVNLLLLLLGISGFVGEVLVLNAMGLRFEYFSDKLFMGNMNCNPFSILIAISAFLLFRQIRFRSSKINYISGLSMICYLVHENMLFRKYYRPAIWQWIYINYGYSNILLITLIYVFVLFVVSMGISILYKETLQKIVAVVSARLYAILTKKWMTLENIVIKIK